MYSVLYVLYLLIHWKRAANSTRNLRAFVHLLIHLLRLEMRSTRLALSLANTLAARGVPDMQVSRRSVFANRLAVLAHTLYYIGLIHYTVPAATRRVGKSTVLYLLKHCTVFAGQYIILCLLKYWRILCSVSAEKLYCMY